MMKINTQACDFIKRTIIIANTPAFLFNRLVKSQVCLDLATANSSIELLNELRSISILRDPTPDDLAYVYALLHALYLKYDTSIEELSKIELPWVEWRNEIFSLFMLCANTTKNISVNTFSASAYEPKTCIKGDGNMYFVSVNVASNA